jgi:hypothetical protein
VLGWPKRCKLAHAFLWETSCKRLQLAQVLGQPAVSLTLQNLSSHLSHLGVAALRERLDAPLVHQRDDAARDAGHVALADDGLVGLAEPGVQRVHLG